MSMTVEEVKLEVIVHGGGPALRLTCTRGEVRKRTRGEHVEIIRMDAAAALVVGRELSRAAEELTAPGQAASCPVRL